MTVIFAGTSNEPSYEPEFEEPVHMELKRDMQGQPLRRDNNETDWEKLPLFEKYQFFTPGKSYALPSFHQSIGTNR